MNTPPEKLAATITEKLVREKLLSRPEAKKIAAKLAKGELRAQDWRDAFELSTPLKPRS
jgi:hypothetical protein